MNVLEQFFHIYSKNNEFTLSVINTPIQDQTA
jgi:hypothetical protein